ncbi:hypothetical protein [Burkholderia perseverans]|uniref:hypothetical protein n=1 Tax=Burkholderia perseverans TaxID=2615214 RepID=UPI001FF04C5E|nr:hypothetical protein [Burkholderia perseverans]
MFREKELRQGRIGNSWRIAEDGPVFSAGLKHAKYVDAWPIRDGGIANQRFSASIFVSIEWLAGHWRGWVNGRLDGFVSWSRREISNLDKIDSAPDIPLRVRQAAHQAADPRRPGNMSISHAAKNEQDGEKSRRRRFHVRAIAKKPITGMKF